MNYKTTLTSKQLFLLQRQFPATLSSFLSLSGETEIFANVWQIKKKVKEYILEDRQQVQSPHEVSTCHATLQCPVSATLLLMQFPANASLEAAGDSSSA